MNEPAEPSQVRTTPYQTPLYNLGGAIVYMTNPQPILDNLEMSYRNTVRTPDGEVKSVGPALMNEVGIQAVLGQIKSIMNQNTIMSSVDKKSEIAPIMEYFGDGLIQDLMLARHKYEMNFHDRTKVYRTANLAVFLTLKRASTERDMSEKTFWRGSVQEIRQTMDQNQGSKGILGAFSGWRKNN